jgi:hypothetical protein
MSGGKRMKPDVVPVDGSNSDPYDFIKPGAMVKFGMWNKPQEHRTGRVVKMADGVVTVATDDGKNINLILANKSLSIAPVSADRQGQMEGATGPLVDAKGRTQAQWVDLVMKQFPDARTSYERSGRRALAQLADGRRLIWKPITPDAFERPKPTMSEGAYNPYGYEVGQTVKLDNGQQGRVIDIFDDSIEVLLVGGRTVTVDFRDAQVIGEQGVAEATGDVKFDKMIKGITGKKEVAKQQKIDTKQQARDAFGGMFGGGNPVDKLSIRKKGMAEGRTK